MQKSFETQRLERDETLGRSLGAGGGGLLAAYAPNVITETLGALPYLKEVAAWLVHTPPVGWTTFLAAAIPNATATIAYNTAEHYLDSTYGKKILLDHSEFHSVVLYGTSSLFFAASALLIAKITGIAVVTILGCSCMGWVANQVIKIAYTLFLSFDEERKKISKKFDMLILSQIGVKKLPAPKEKKGKPLESVALLDPPPIDVELWQMAESIPCALASNTVYALDFICKNTFSSIEAKEADPFEWTEEVNSSCSIKGIPNIGNSSHQNSATQILIHLIETIEEKDFEIYKIKKTPPLKIEVNAEIILPLEPPIDDKKIGDSKEPTTLQYFTSFLPNIFGNQKIAEEDAPFIPHLERLAMKKLGIEGKTEENAQKILECTLKYLHVFKVFEQMRKEYKDCGIQRSTCIALRKALDEFFFSDDAITSNTPVSTPKDPREVLSLMIDILGGKKMPDRLNVKEPLPPYMMLNSKHKDTPKPTIYVDLYNDKGEVCEWRKCTLISATIHPHGSSSGEHWTSYVYKKGQWYLCDDRSIRKIKDMRAMFKIMSENGTDFTYKIENNVIKEDPTQLSKFITNDFDLFGDELFSKFSTFGNFGNFGKNNFFGNFGFDHYDPNDYDRDWYVENKKPCTCKPFKDPENFKKLQASPAVTPLTRTGTKNIVNSCYQNSALRVLMNLFNRVKEPGFEIYEMINTPKEYAEKRIRGLRALNNRSDQEEKELKDLQEIVETNKYISGIEEKNLVLMVHLNKLIESKTALKENKISAHLYLQVLRSFQQMLKDQRNKDGIKDETAIEFREAVHKLHFQHQIQKKEIDAQQDFQYKKNENEIDAQQDPGDLLLFLSELLGVRSLPLQELSFYHLNQENLKEVEKSRELLKIDPFKVNVEDTCSLPKYEETKYNFAENVEKQPFDFECNNNPIITRSMDPTLFSEKNTIPTLEGLVINLGKNERDSFCKGKDVLCANENNPNEMQIKQRSYPHIFPEERDLKDKNSPYSKFEGPPIRVIDTHTKAYILSTDVPKVQYGIFEFKRYTVCDSHSAKKHHVQMMPNEVMEIPIFDEKENKETGILKMTLIGACVHPYGGIDGGHWISYVLEEDGWHLYDDDKVGKVEDKKQMFDQMSVNGTIFTYVIEEIKN